MTNTTRQLTFRHEPGGNILFRASTEQASPGFPLAVTTDKAKYPIWSLLDADAVEDLHELTGLILAGRKLEYGDDGVQDARLFCGARHGERLVCILDEDHAWPTPLGPHGHISADGTAFLVNPDAADLPH